MYKQFCDRCGRTTKNSAAFLLPCTKERGSYQVNATWFGDPIILCNYCLKDFDSFRTTHENFNKELVDDREV